MEGAAFPNRTKQKPSPGQEMLLPVCLGVLFLVTTALSLREEDTVTDGDSFTVGIV